MKELLEAAEDLQREAVSMNQIIPDNMEEWICCNDPDVDAILSGTLVPKGTQDRTRIFIAKINEAKRAKIQRDKELQQQLREEYIAYLNMIGMTEDESEYDDQYSDSCTQPIVADEKDLQELNEEILQQTDINSECTEVNISTDDNISILDDNQSTLEHVNQDIIVRKTTPKIEVDTHDVKLNVSLQINPNLSATKNFINILKSAESMLTPQQRLCFCNKQFTTTNLNLSLPLLIPYSADTTARFINGRSRYINKIFEFNGQPWFLTNNIYKQNVNKLINILNNMLKENNNENSGNS